MRRPNVRRGERRASVIVTISLIWGAAAIAVILALRAERGVEPQPAGESGVALPRARQAERRGDAAQESPRRAEGVHSAAAARMPQATGADSDTIATGVTATKKRNLLVAAHERGLLAQADERVFETLGLADPLRESIREINDDWNEAKRAQLGADLPGRTAAEEEAADDVSGAALDRARASMLENVLGAVAFQAFASAEQEALTRVRSRFGAWAERIRAGRASSPLGVLESGSADTRPFK